ncbi:DUF3891 family protein [Microcoleus sp. FACHB-68]|uniref:DUF3891 family protein n=1 Tax=Microcoleus sp. FACHB-68 TaxID=2692826 RepID=UPI001681E48A|nr:DUF3891 family protein [Microcoleus sp. FACHB-68]
MIVNLVENGWEVIYHRAHALLAAQLAGQWKKSESPPRLYETIAAISHHDDLEREWEGNQLTEAGAPLDFTLDKKTSLPKLRELTTNSRYRGRWVAMLISMHTSFLNEGKRGESEELDQFLDEQLENQKKWRKELKITKKEAEEAYAFFQWCDRLSLILCMGNLPAGQRFLEISKGPDGERYDILERSDGLVTVKPWPFDAEKFTVNVEASSLNQIKFDSNDELKEALQTAPIKTLEWTFVKS